MAGIPDEVRGVPTNICRTALHPAGLAGRTRNLAQWSAHLLWHLDRAVVRTRDAAPGRARQRDRDLAVHPGRKTWRQLSAEAGDDPVVPWRLEPAAGGAFRSSRP